MTNTAWHAEYLRLENAEAATRAAYRSARGAAKKEAALETFRATPESALGISRWPAARSWTPRHCR